MYLTKQEFQVRTGRLTDWEAFAERAFSLMERAPGLERVSNLSSYGYPTKYAIVALWDSREQARAFTHSDESCQFLAQAQPQQFATPLTPMEAFEVVHRIGTGHGAKVGYIIDQKVEPGAERVQAYEDARLKLFQLREQHGTGFVVNILARFLGSGNRYLVFGAFTDAESEAATAAMPELIQYWKDYGPATIPITLESREPYEFVHVAGRRPVPEA